MKWMKNPGVLQRMYAGTRDGHSALRAGRGEGGGAK